MPQSTFILKFWKKGDSNVILDNLNIENITEDKRTSLIDKKSFLKQKFYIESGVYIAVNDLFFKFANLLKTSKKEINAIYMNYENNVIIIIPSRSYVFWNGKSVEPNIYEISETEIDIGKLLNL